MIRVLQVVNAADRGGSETLVMNIYRNIDRSMIQFDFTNHNGHPAAYDEEITSLGGKILYLPKFKGYNYFTYIRAWRLLFKNHPEYRIVHIHNYNIAGIVAKVARQKGITVRITHAHSTRLNMVGLKKLVFKMFHRSIMLNSTHFFSCGRKAAQFLFGSNHDYKIIPNAIDTQLFKFDNQKRNDIRASLGIDENCMLYGHVGSFRKPKNHLFLVEIFSSVVKNNPNSRLVLVGSGELMPVIKDKVKQLGLSDNIFFVGQQSKVNEWLSAFDAFLMPSLWEGFPVSVVEAQCAGLPCAISDVVDQDADITGFVKFVPLNYAPADWAIQIEKLSRPNRFKMGEQIEKSDFNIKTLTMKLTNFYLKSIKDYDNNN